MLAREVDSHGHLFEHYLGLTKPVLFSGHYTYLDVVQRLAFVKAQLNKGEGA